MHRRLLLGLFAAPVLASSALVGCAEPVPMPGPSASKPEAVARVASASSTVKTTGAITWRIYGGHTQMVVMGFGKDKKPVPGMRVRFATSSDAGWWLSLESLRQGGGMMRLSPDGNSVVLDTTTSKDKVLMHGAMRALTAYAKKFAAKGDVATKAVAFADTDPCALPKLAERAAACASARPVCQKQGSGKALLCSSGVLKCAEDAAKVAEQCAQKALASGGAKEKAKNPAPKTPASSGSSAGTPSSSGSGTKAGSNTGSKTGSKTGAKQPSEKEDPNKTCSEGGEDEVDCPGTCEEGDEEGRCPDTKEPCEDAESGDEECKSDPQEEDENENENDPEAEEPEADASEGDDAESSDDVDPDPDFGGDDFGGDDVGGDVDFEAFGLGKGALGTQALRRIATASNTDGASCGKGRVLVCGGRSKASGFCRCVAR